MSRVRSRNTKPELRVRQLLRQAGYGYRLHLADLPGRPDIYLSKHKLAVFVHGCFWHGHEGCRRAKLPDTRREFWEEKIRANKRRDEAAIRELAIRGIVSVAIWECEIRSDCAIIDLINFKVGHSQKTATDTA